MPYTIRKVPNKKCYSVTNARTKKVFARCSSKKNAVSQMRLLRAIENNKSFVLRADRRRVPKRGTQRKRS